MNTEVIDKAFADAIAPRGAHHKLGITSVNLRTLRHKLATGVPISYELKLQLLQRSGWQHDDFRYTRQDLVSLLRFWQHTSAAAREMGEEYVIEKWEAQKS